MKNTIICIGRQYGSGGREIGEKLAEHLGMVCYDKLLLQKTAKASGLALETVESEDEQPVGLSSLVSGNPFADSAFLSQTFYSEELKVAQAEQQTILNLAQKGCCVFIGRCAASTLKNAGFNVLSVFVYGDADDKAQRIARRNGIDVKAALRKMQKVDHMRRRYCDFYSDTPWGDPSSYDLMLSSSSYGIDGAVRVIEKAWEEKNQ